MAIFNRKLFNYQRVNLMPQSIRRCPSLLISIPKWSRSLAFCPQQNGGPTPPAKHDEAAEHETFCRESMMSVRTCWYYGDSQNQSKNLLINQTISRKSPELSRMSENLVIVHRQVVFVLASRWSMFTFLVMVGVLGGLVIWGTEATKRMIKWY